MLSSLGIVKLVNFLLGNKKPPEETLSFYKIIKTFTEEYKSHQVDVIKIYNLMKNPCIETIFDSGQFSSKSEVTSPFHDVPISENDVPI